MWRNFATQCKNTTIKGPHQVHCDDNSYVRPIVKYPFQKPPFIQNCYYVVVIRHTNVITIIVDCKQGHLGAFVLVIASTIHTCTPPPPIWMLHPFLRYGLMWARFGWRFWIPWGRSGNGCTVSRGGGAGFATGFLGLGFGLGLGLGRRVICITLWISAPVALQSLTEALFAAEL